MSPRTSASEKSALGESAPRCGNPREEKAGFGTQTGTTPAASGDQDHDALKLLAHELRTPIAAIVTLAEMIQSGRCGAPGQATCDDYVADIRASATQALAVLGRMLDDAVAAGSPGAPVAVPVQPGGVIAECLAVVAPAAESANVTLTIDDHADSSEGVADIITDPTRLRQIMINLLANAVKFTPDGGQVTVGCDDAGDEGLVISVRDTGIGMSAYDLGVLHGSSSAAETSDRQHEGEAIPGVGLNLIRTLAGDCGAMFSIESERGRGTLASLTFPPERICRGN